MRFGFIALLAVLFSAPAHSQNTGYAQTAAYMPEGTVVAPRAVMANRILVEKAKRQLTLFHDNEVLKTYTIVLGIQPVGPKRVLGDNKTPEGFYTVDSRRENSDYHLALHISYPNEDDIKRAHAIGQHAGGRIMIHGLPYDFGMRKRKRDWTHGCIAVANRDIAEIWNLVPDGTPIEIRP